LAGGSRLVRRCFEQHPQKTGFLTNDKVFELWQERLEWKRKSSEGGLKAARNKELKALKGGSTTVHTKPQPNGYSSSSSSSSSSSTPLPPPLASSPEDPEWAAVEAALDSEGLLTAGEVVGSARARACTPAKVFEVIEHYRSNKPAWGPGALGERIQRLRMHQAANELWPEPATAPTSKAPGKSREAHQAELDRKRAEAESMAAAEAARLAELERLHGPELDSKSRDWVRTAMFERSPESAELMLRSLPAKGPPGPGMLRLELLEYLASKEKPP
jgi:hypothetical protein